MHRFDDFPGPAMSGGAMDGGHQASESPDGAAGTGSECRRSGLPFREVFEAELEAVAARRQAVRVPGDCANKACQTGGICGDKCECENRHDPRSDLTGLAFSGGGIRSATFALGVLQGLAGYGLLRRFDYLSTVSGGGYIGGWLAAWIQREGSLENVERQLDPSRARAGSGPGCSEPAPIRHLRAYSNYLAPRPGLFSADSWTVLSIYARNLLINLLVLLPATLAVIVASRLIVWLFGWGPPAATGGLALVRHAGAALFFMPLLWAFRNIARERWTLHCAAVGRFGAVGEGPGAGSDIPASPAALSCGRLHRGIVWPLVLASVFGAWTFARNPGEPAGTIRLPVAPGMYAGLVPALGEHAGATALAVSLGGLLLGVGAGANLHLLRLGRQRAFVKLTMSFFAVGAIGGLLLHGLLLRPFLWRDAVSPWAVASFGPPGLLLILVGAGYVDTALGGRAITEHEREWRSRLAALLLMHALGWMAFFAATLYLPWALQRLAAGHPWGQVVDGSLVLGWLATALGGARVGARSRGGRRRLARCLAAIAPPVFLVGLLAACSCLVSATLRSLEGLGPGSWMLVPGEACTRLAVSLSGGTAFLVEAARAPLVSLVLLLGAMSLTMLVATLAVDVNLFSLHAMYANRLVRCYLGASRTAGPGASRTIGTMAATRSANPVTGFDPADDFPLANLRNDRDGVGYQGPYPLFNAALNLVAGGSLAEQDRKAESFVLSPGHCGAVLTGYAPTPGGLEHAENLTLGRALAISGAAADPNMGYNQSAAQTALMTVFNARLGWWLENPNVIGGASGRGWTAAGPNVGSLLLAELLGRTNGSGDHVHLSDGGHFENLGVYELIRRRCRYIVAVDAAEDRDPTSNNLANLVRLCRIDFGVPIEIDTGLLEQTGSRRLSRRHCAVGTIRYDEADRTEAPGILVYVRISLTGDEPPDVQEYAAKHPAFPHELTIPDQFFDEPQFESYRALGLHIARVVFAPVASCGHLGMAESRSAGALEAPSDGVFEGSRPRGHRELFAELARRWSAAPVRPEPARPRTIARSLRRVAAHLERRNDPRGEPGQLRRRNAPEAG